MTFRNANYHSLLLSDKNKVGVAIRIFSISFIKYSKSDYVT